MFDLEAKCGIDEENFKLKGKSIDVPLYVRKEKFRQNYWIIRTDEKRFDWNEIADEGKAIYDQMFSFRTSDKQRVLFFLIIDKQ